MSLYKTYAVFGLGRYGRAVAKELVDSGADVLAVDLDINAVNLAAKDIPICKCADITNAETLNQLGIKNIDVVIIAMANSLEASVMATMLCKEAGVKTVIVKCSNETHGKIFEKVGADKVVQPENESGVRLAKNLLSSGFVDLVELTNDVSMVELNVKTAWVGKTLKELDLRKKYSLNVVAIGQNGKISVNIEPDMPLTEDMRLIVIANTAQLSKLK